MKFKSLPTKYKNIQFRSKTEARWAVYFDLIGLKWIYEEKGYQLPNGQYYLPDFRIPGFGWIEIKGSKPTDDEIEKARLLSMNSEYSSNYDENDKSDMAMFFEMNVMVCDGKPDPKRSYRVFNNNNETCNALFCRHSVGKWGSDPFYCGFGLYDDEILCWLDEDELECYTKANNYQFHRDLFD